MRDYVTFEIGSAEPPERYNNPTPIIQVKLVDGVIRPGDEIRIPVGELQRKGCGYRVSVEVIRDDTPVAIGKSLVLEEPRGQAK